MSTKSPSQNSPSQKPTVLITDQIHPAAGEILADVATVVYESTLSSDVLKARLAEFDGILIRSATHIHKDHLSTPGSKLKIIGRAGVGVDNVDLQAATEAGVIVVNSPEGNTIAAAEHTLAMMLSLARRIPQADEALKHGKWQRSQYTGVELFGKTLGLIGLGKIGSRVATSCLALGMEVLVFDPFLKPEQAEAMGVSLVTLEVIWKRADFITIHAPKTAETTHLLNQETLSQCKKGVRIINCARGGIIDEAALLTAIHSGHVAGAALDVFEQEPLPAESTLFKDLSDAQHLVLTPHLGASTEEAQVNVALDVAHQLKAFFESGVAKNAVNMPSLRKEILDPVRPYLLLAEILGKLCRQITEGPAQSVEVILKGAISPHQPAPLTLAVLKGLLSTSHEGVNFVNARLIADRLGIEITESNRPSVHDYMNALEVILTTQTPEGAQRVNISGTLISEGHLRITDLNGYPLSLEPSAHLLLTPHLDRPGMVGKVSTLLGEAGVNIQALQVTRKAGSNIAGGQSMMVFNLDSALPESMLTEISSIDGLFDARYLSL
ncbi:MAG: phosphoglycerate dehydrogenase [Cyanobacteria bacterium]|nr:phosphoglycerate dehydrogenase [Cyanobacteriota bacterium]